MVGIDLPAGAGGGGITLSMGVIRADSQWTTADNETAHA